MTGALYDTPHGVANAIILPTVANTMRRAGTVQVQDVAIAMGVEGVGGHEPGRVPQGSRGCGMKEEAVRRCGHPC